MKEFLEDNIRQAEEELAELQKKVEKILIELETISHDSLVLDSKAQAWKEALDVLLKPQ